MADIFISYSHEDQPFVRRMVPALEAEGFSVWWDHSIPPGQSWDTFIAAGIRDAKAAIVVWSPHSVNSDWVKEEATLARAGGKYLPIQIDGAEPPMGFQRIQAARLAAWEGDPHNAQWQMLLGAAHALIRSERAHAIPNAGSARSTSQGASQPTRSKNLLTARFLFGTLALAAVAGAVWWSFEGQQQTQVATSSSHNAQDTQAAPAAAASPQQTGTVESRSENAALRQQTPRTTESPLSISEAHDQQPQPSPQPTERANPMQEAAADPAAIELAMWQQAQRADTAPAFQDYLRQYPNGRFHVEAEQNVARLNAASTAAANAAALAPSSGFLGLWRKTGGGGGNPRPCRRFLEIISVGDWMVTRQYDSPSSPQTVRERVVDVTDTVLRTSYGPDINHVTVLPDGSLEMEYGSFFMQNVCSYERMPVSR